MAQVTVNLPSISNWKTTLFGIVTAVGAAVMQQLQTGHLSLPVGIGCALWAVFCYLVPDAKNNNQGQAELQALIDAAFAKQAAAAPDKLAPEVAARTAAPETNTSGQPLL